MQRIDIGEHRKCVCCNELFFWVPRPQDMLHGLRWYARADADSQVCEECARGECDEKRKTAQKIKGESELDKLLERRLERMLRDFK